MSHSPCLRRSLGRLGVLLLLLACQLPGRAAPTAAPAPPPLPPTTTAEPSAPLQGSALPLPEVTAVPFAPFNATPAALGSAPSYQPDLAALANPVDLPVLDADQRAFLAQNGYILLDGVPLTPHEFLARTAARGQPILITSDLILYTAQAVFQQSWRQAQREYLFVRLSLLTDGLSTASGRQMSSADPLTAEAARRNLAYLSVAGQLLDPGFPVDPAVAELVQSELALISLGGQFISPLQGRMVDYSPLAEAPAGYARAVLWYQTVGFPVDPAAADVRRWGRQINLMLAALHEGDLYAQWEPIAAAHAYFEGEGGTPFVLWDALAAAQTPLDTFILTAAQLPAPTFYLLPPPERPWDTVAPQLVYNRVGGFTGSTNPPFTAGETAVGTVRLLPRVLDMAAVLGSDLALAELAAAGDSAYTGYSEQVDLLRLQFTEQNTAQAADTWQWVLQPLLDSGGGRGLASWQVGWLLGEMALPDAVVAKGEGAVTEGAAVLIEPQLELYARLRGQTRQIYAGLQGRSILSAPNGERLLALERLLVGVAQMAVHQAEGRGLTEGEAAFAAALLPSLGELAPPPTLPLAAVIYTEPATGQQLVSEWVGVRPYHVLTLYEGHQIVAAGVVFETHEIKR